MKHGRPLRRSIRSLRREINFIRKIIASKKWGKLSDIERWEIMSYQQALSWAAGENAMSPSRCIITFKVLRGKKKELAPKKRGSK